MCGIGGVAGAPPGEGLLERMAATMVKRGPDGHGTWSDESAGLAATRLAIIDLHDRSNQPMHFGPLHLAFNGEIYNYRELREELRRLGHTFVTEGDAEVLIHAWAEWEDEALDRFNGMFAFAIWDETQRKLTLAADPFGEKPLYYALCNGRIVFASEIKALLHDPEVPASPDHAAVADYLASDVMTRSAGSYLSGIRRLPGSHVLTFHDGKVHERRYWTPQPVAVPAAYDDAVASLRELLVDSIRLRLRSDVPVGTSLSGGIDSSTVVMLSSELAGEHTRHAFTARFPGFERDEWVYASEVADRAGVVEHHAVEPNVDELLGDLRALVRDHEEPVRSLSIYAQWRVMQAAKDAGVTVLLDGQGGDELFAGYLPVLGWALRSGGMRQLAHELRREPRRGRAVMRSLAVDFLPMRLRRSHRRFVGCPYAATALIASAAETPLQPLTPWFEDGTPLRRQLVAQAFVTSLPHLLRYADRSSMAWSREVRLPYLDRRIAEFAFSLPTNFLYADGVTKRILRDVGRGLVSDSVLDRRAKVGFEPPQQLWLNDDRFRKMIGEVLLDPGSEARGLYNVSAIEEDLRRERWRDSAGIWRALSTELWLREIVDGRADEPGAPIGRHTTSSITPASRSTSRG
jgi:asparagine synthase (glutamine-hydrolysing)